MEVTDELKDYSHREIFDDCFKKKKIITKYMILILWQFV